MLASFRRSVRTWAAGAILLFALIAIVVTGFGTDGMGGLGAVGGGQTSEALVRVGGQSVTDRELNTIINQQFRQARTQQPTLDMATFLQAGAFDGILNQMALGAAIRAFGDEQGMVVSQRMIDRELLKIPQFRNFSGQFDMNVFRQALDRQGLDENQVYEDIADSLMQRQIMLPIGNGLRTPDTIAREYANLLLERRRGAIGVIPAERLSAGINPTPSQLTAYYTRNRGRFTIPERRVIRYAMIGPEQLGAAAQASDAEIAAYYRQNQATYGPRETRDLQQIVLPDRNAATAFANRVRGGTPFADAAAQAGFSARDINLAGQTRQQHSEATSAAVANAAFGAQQGAVVGPLQGSFGFYVIRVERITTTPARPLESVRAEIAAAVSQRKIADALAAVVTRIEEQVSDGNSLEEIARAERLQLVTTPPITATGQVPGQVWAVPPELQPLLTAAFEIDPENPEPLVEQVTPNQRFALVGIERVVPAAPPPLAQIQDAVRIAFIQETALGRARTVAQQIVDKINRGMPAAQAFAEAQNGLEAPRSVDMQRLEISRGGQQVPPPLLALFSLPQGRARLLPAPNGAGWFVVNHVQRTPGDARTQPTLIATTRAEFSQSAAVEMQQQFARAVERQLGAERNAEAIARARQQLLGDATQ